MTVETETYKRLARNFVLEPHFQFKWTAYLLAVAVVISLVLGAFLTRASHGLLQQTQQAVDARSRAADASRELGRVALSDSLLQHMQDPGFTAQMKKRSAEIDGQYEQEREAIEQQREGLLRTQGRVRVGLTLGLCAFIACIGLAGIVATHRMVGPLYRVKQLATQVGEGKYLMPSRPLRQGDEFQDVMEALTQMIERLRLVQQEDARELEHAVAALQGSGSTEALQTLRALQTRVQARLGEKVP